MADAERKSLTFISRKAPYGNENSQVCLDMVLASSVYEQQVNYLFLEDGVYQLLKSQQPSSIASKNLAASLTALEVYGVEKVYVEEDSLQARNLDSKDLILPVEILDSEQMKILIRDSHVVFNL